MDKTDFLTIYGTFENLEVVKQTLPSIVEETKRSNSKLIVHDSSVNNREEKWKYLQDLNKDNDFFLILSSNMSMAHSRNMCLQLGQELYAPEYVCMLEDDHAFSVGGIDILKDVMSKYYGKVSTNGLMYGLFTGCSNHFTPFRMKVEDDLFCPSLDNEPMKVGKANSCFRCAPTNHWNNVLKGYDTDEYLISTFQTSNLNLRNYHKGYTSMLIINDVFYSIDNTTGRGTSDIEKKRLWDDKFCRSDKRSKSRG
ncbi:MAG: hypothetical protein EOL88_00890 [Bacteroidia bacterium]|nr:hypothetical protein [Bacteroidia bacterium]